MQNAKSERGPNPLRAIRAKCLDCSGGNRAHVRDCPIEECPIWAYRMGRNPARKGIGGKKKMA